MIYTKISSGLGNQLFQYALARQLSLKSNIPLKLDISFYDTQNLRNYKLDHYNIKASIATKDEVEHLLSVYNRKSIYSKLYNGIERRLPKYFKKHYYEDEWWVFEPEVFKTFGNVYLDGYWQNYKYFQNFDKRIFNEFTLKHDYSVEYKIISVIQQDPLSVSLHIRRGDYVNDSYAKNLMGILPLDYYYKAIKYLKEKLIRPSFYIFSDDLEWAKNNLHIDTDVTYMDIENGNKDYLELYMMSLCRNNVIANSSFSWWGAFLNQNPNKIIITPAQWVQSDITNSKINIQFPNWVKL